MSTPEILFVCSQGYARSRTAEVLCLLGGVPARSCGTDANALACVNADVLTRVDHVVCMTQAHAKLVKRLAHAEGFPEDAPRIIALAIPDVFDPFEPALVEALVQAVDGVLPEVAAAMRRGAGAARQLGYLRERVRLADDLRLAGAPRLF